MARETDFETLSAALAGTVGAVVLLAGVDIHRYSPTICSLSRSIWRRLRAQVYLNQAPVTAAPALGELIRATRCAWPPGLLSSCRAAAENQSTRPPSSCRRLQIFLCPFLPSLTSGSIHSIWFLSIHSFHSFLPSIPFPSFLISIPSNSIQTGPLVIMVARYAGAAGGNDAEATAPLQNCRASTVGAGDASLASFAAAPP